MSPSSNDQRSVVVLVGSTVNTSVLVPLVTPVVNTSGNTNIHRELLITEQTHRIGPVFQTLDDRCIVELTPLSNKQNVRTLERGPVRGTEQGEGEKGGEGGPGSP